MRSGASSSARRRATFFSTQDHAAAAHRPPPAFRSSASQGARCCEGIGISLDKSFHVAGPGRNMIPSDDGADRTLLTSSWRHAPRRGQDIIPRVPPPSEETSRAWRLHRPTIKRQMEATPLVSSRCATQILKACPVGDHSLASIPPVTNCRRKAMLAGVPGDQRHRFMTKRISIQQRTNGAREGGGRLSDPGTRPRRARRKEKKRGRGRGEGSPRPWRCRWSLSAYFRLWACGSVRLSVACIGCLGGPKKGLRGGAAPI